MKQLEPYWKAFKYLVRHKYYVGKELVRYGLYWRAITHDLTKLLPSEFIPYAKYHYSPSLTCKCVFDRAANLHKSRNQHHWEYWTYDQRNGYLYWKTTEDMSWAAAVEMVCDWVGVEKMCVGATPAYEFYQNLLDKDNIYITKKTKEIVDTIFAFRLNPRSKILKGN